MAKYQKIVGETPNGGNYSEIYYFDDKGNIVDETKATKCVVRECGENGDMIAETWAINEK